MTLPSFPNLMDGFLGKKKYVTIAAKVLEIKLPKARCLSRVERLIR